MPYRPYFQAVVNGAMRCSGKVSMRAPCEADLMSQRAWRRYYKLTKDMVSKQNCILCGGVIDSDALTFEQRLIKDEDFCRTCWNDIMHKEYEGEVPLPHLWPANA